MSGQQIFPTDTPLRCEGWREEPASPEPSEEDQTLGKPREMGWLCHSFCCENAGVKTIRNTTLACYHYVPSSVSHLGHSRGPPPPLAENGSNKYIRELTKDLSVFSTRFRDLT